MSEIELQKSWFLSSLDMCPAMVLPPPCKVWTHEAICREGNRCLGWTDIGWCHTAQCSQYTRKVNEKQPAVWLSSDQEMPHTERSILGKVQCSPYSVFYVHRRVYSRLILKYQRTQKMRVSGFVTEVHVMRCQTQRRAVITTDCKSVSRGLPCYQKRHFFTFEKKKTTKYSI